MKPTHRLGAMFKKVPFHPILFTIFPILSLFASNTDQLRFQNVVSTLLIAVSVAVVMWLLVYAFVRDVAKAGLIVSAFLFLFFSFKSLLLGIEILGDELHFVDQAYRLTESTPVMMGWLVFGLALWGLLTWRIIKGGWDLSKVTQAANAIGICLLLTALGVIVRTTLQSPAAFTVSLDQFEAQWVKQVAAEPKLPQPSPGELPDIYYIILDGHARSDILDKMYGVDNSQLIDFLAQKGFYVATEATSNYQSTPQSLSSSLNYEYLDGAIEQFAQTKDVNPSYILINRNRVFSQLRSIGYRIATFSTGFVFTELNTADEYETPGVAPNAFQNTLIGNTPLSIFLIGEQYGWHRSRILYTLDHLPDFAQKEGPYFVFAHILAPHPPFVLGENGEPIYPNRTYSINDASDYLILGSQEEYIAGYRNQVRYIDSRVISLVQQILDRSSVPPIIIIQGDHGPGLGLDYYDPLKSDLQERMSILNAYYLPGIQPSPFYQTITPVNTFRVIFNHYFGADYPLLEDRNYVSPVSDPYHFTEVTDRVQAENTSTQAGK